MDVLISILAGHCALLLTTHSRHACITRLSPTNTELKHALCLRLVRALGEQMSAPFLAYRHAHQ